MRDLSTQLAKEAKEFRDKRVLGGLTRAQELDFESQRLWKLSSIELSSAMENVMRQADVVVATCISAGDSKLKDQDFRVVLIDEATQATQPSTLVALTRGAENVIMAGDDMQLPPTIVSSKAKQLGLDISLFARMRHLGIEPELLNEQYRMHPCISEFPSNVFYNGKVATGVSAAARPPVYGIVDYIAGSKSAMMEFPVLFVDCKGPEGKGLSRGSHGQSYKNIEQADVAMELVRVIVENLGASESANSCAILTPYNGQLDLLRNSMSADCSALASDGWLTLSTVDGFQGREADVVILTTVRSNEDGKLGFVRDPRRMNVAITRAKRCLVVIGNRRTLAQDALWSHWLNWLDAQRASYS
jgi:superfamily I DNA and/or RNA helicase